MAEMLHISDVVQKYISGDWGEENNIDNSLVKVACVRGADINDVNESKFDSIPVRYISATSLSKKSLDEGNIVIEKSGGAPNQSTGRVAYISRECKETHPNVVCSNFCEAFSVKPEWDSRYIFYYLQFFYKTGVFFNYEGKTSGLHNLDIEHAFEAIPIKKIDISEQRKKANILATIERKIALNRSINANLEALTRLLYEYWFVQFDFLDANGKPYKSSGGKMVYNEHLKREIPEGWNICRLEDFVKANNTGDWGADEIADGLFEVGCIRGADILTLTDIPKRYIKSESKLLSEHDIVIEASGGSPIQATGRSAYVTKGVIERNGGKITCSNFCHAFTLKDIHKAPFFYYSWRLLYDNDNMFNYEGKTSGLKNFMTEMFLKNYWVDAPQNLVNDFFNKVSAWFALIDTNIAEISSLTRQRDELLPLLMNGQITIE